MTGEQKTILRILANALFDSKLDYSVEDWSLLYSEAIHQAVFVLVYEEIEKSKIPEDVQQSWSKKSYTYKAKNAVVFHNHSLLHQWMNSSKIPYVVIKGVASASYYPHPLYRTMGDVDFLIPKEYINHAGKIFELHGLKSWNKEHDAHIVYRASKMHYEMHFAVAGIPEGTPGEKVREYLSDIVTAASVKSIGDSTYVLPSPFHHGLVILLHTVHHLTSEGVGLRHLCDWAVFANSISETEFCKLFEKKLKSIGLWKFAQVLTRVCIKYLGTEERAWALCDNEEIVDLLMEDILASGNFGNKEKERFQEGLLISSRGKNGVGKNGMFYQFIKSGNYVIKQKWPFTRKNALFLLFGWVLNGFRHIGLLITGKKKMVKGNRLIKNARKRRELYSQLKLYE